ncbi:hypothetical protein ACTFIW_000195 (mitochondrion) [Dictyostelium discoideum]
MKDVNASRNIVTKSIKSGQSAGNFKSLQTTVLNEELNIKSSSETLCEKITKISDHVKKHTYPKTDDEFGYYLAGLIDGDGCFIKKQLVITLPENDNSFAYYLKKRLGYGQVYKVKGKKALNFIISHREGLKIVLNLINGKLKTKSKILQIQTNILPYFKEKEIQIIDSLCDKLENYWISGFTDAEGSFQIKIIKRKDRKHEEIRICLQIDQKKIDLLDLIKTKFGGSIGYRKKTDNYSYNSVNLSNTVRIIKYFDQYKLLSIKYLNYIKWRKAYRMVEQGTHLTERVIIKIKTLKNSMNRKLSIKVI